MGVYQRDGRFMVYWHEEGKRRDKSFGRGEVARLQAEAFDLAIREAKANLNVPVQEEQVTEPGSDPVAYQEEPGAGAGEVQAEMPLATSVATVAAVAIPAKGVNFGQLSMMYLDHLRVSGRTPKHIANLENLLKSMFFDILGRDTLVEGMTYLKDIVPFIKEMQGISHQTKRPRSQSCQTAPKIDPQSASNFDPLELSVMASPRGRGGGAYWLLCLSLQLSLPVSMISQ